MNLCTEPTVTDGGLETDLMFHRGVELPEFAAYPLLRGDHGRDLLRQYYAGYGDIARSHGAGLLLEAPTWRASASWGHRLGDSAADLHHVNAYAITWLHSLRTSVFADLATVTVGGMIGPRDDAYATATMDVDEAQRYHRPQVEALAGAGADLVTAYTLTVVNEAIGIVQAARAAGVPVGIAFTVETDGCLPDGTSLAGAMAAVDAIEAPDHYLVNCAHPSHIARGLASLTPRQRDTIRGVRGNASTLSHAELDESTTLEDGDPAAFASATAKLSALLPNLSILGGCCGTDTRHVAAIWSVSTLVGRGPE